jgi:[acyl-carrier-protein] S-malonyltransferase
LAAVALRRPLVPLVANVTASAVSEPRKIKELLVEQLTAMVRWRESVLFLAVSAIDEIVEIGTGRVLSALAKRIAPEVAARSVGTPEEIATLATAG